MAKWFFLIDGREGGPIESGDLKRLADAGRLKPQHKVRKDGMAVWHEAGQVKGLFLAAQPHLSPPQSPTTDLKLAANHVSASNPTGTEHAPNDPDWIEQRQDLINVSKWISEFGAIRWGALFPIGSWIKDRPWSLVWVQLFTFAFCFPFLLIQYYQGRNASLLEAAWAFSLYFAILWAAFLHRCMRPDSLKRRSLIVTWFFTAFLGVLAVTLVGVVGRLLPGFRDLIAASESASILGRLLGFTLSVGLIEEAAKAIPVMWFTLRKDKAIRPTTAAYLGVISGLAFGSTEAIVYSMAYAAGHAASLMSYGDYLVVQVLRFVSLPLLHAVWSGTFGYFIGLAGLTRNGRAALLVVGLVLVSILHGAYDAFASGWLGLVVAVVSLFLFIGYIRTDTVVTLGIVEGSGKV